jgi:hypothetical protein
MTMPRCDKHRGIVVSSVVTLTPFS